jgi:predicted S18 family serine protease
MRTNRAKKSIFALAALLATTAPGVTADCSAAASRVVSQTGGQLLSATPQQQGGGTVCVITVLVPGNGDERPKKVTVSVPA